MEDRGEFPDQQAYIEDEAHISSAKPSDKELSHQKATFPAFAPL